MRRVLLTIISLPLLSLGISHPVEAQNGMTGTVLSPEGYDPGAGNPMVFVTRGRTVLARKECDADGVFEFQQPEDGKPFDIVVMSDLFQPCCLRGLIDVNSSLKVQLIPPPVFGVDSDRLSDAVAENLRSALRAIEDAQFLLPDTEEFRALLQSAKEEITLFNPVSVLIPAYFYPGGSTLGEWDQLLTFVKDLNGQAVVILNINNGASPGQIEPSYLALAKTLSQARVPWIGYVDLTYAKRPHSEIQKDLDQWLSYPGCYGYFFDQTPSSQGEVIQPVLEYAHSLLRRKRIRTPVLIGNTGTQCDGTLTGTKMFTGVCVKENLFNAMSFERPLWHTAKSETSIGAISYGVNTEAAFKSEFKKIVSHGGGFLYLTDQDGQSETLWTRLPSTDLRQLTIQAVKTWNDSIAVTRRELGSRSKSRR